MADLEQLVARYVSLWNEPDPEARRATIRALWAPDGAQVLVDPPEEMRRAAAELSFPAPLLDVRGHDALEARARRAYEMFIASGEHIFRSRHDASQPVDNVVSFTWDMATRDGEVAGAGFEVLALDTDGKIEIDYQFIDGSRR